MRQLSRGPEPALLKRFRGGRDAWEDLPAGDRQALWAALTAMQGEVCAYCEGQAVPGRRHIEHFRPRHRYPQHTFSWDNLFGNCGDTKTCGHRKDAPKARAYAVENLIKPDEEDPDTFFHFVGDGSIAVREGLAPRQAARARETLRVLGLDEPAGGLRRRRRQALAYYVQLVDDWAAIADSVSSAELRGLFEEEVAAAADQEFSTAIRHLLLGPRPSAGC
jgi:uncharacterized protein (TIGR02646 family)